jgi:hypothetical protein
MAVTVTLPTLHAGQVQAFEQRARFFALRCGRRFGKTMLGETFVTDGATRGQNMGVFAPDYKILTETYNEIIDILMPIRRASSKTEGVIRTTTGGRVDFWTLENERAGRSRKYHGVFIDEAAFTKPNMTKVWETAIKPSLLDYRGWAMVASTPNGINPDNFFYRVCTDPKYGFKEFHAPTRLNPFLPVDELEKLKAANHPLVYQQEYEAEFVDWSGVQFFSQDDLLEDGQPVEYPSRCDSVFAILDTANKTGNEHDGTAVSYWGYTRHGRKLVCLDWDMVQIEGAFLEVWLPQVFARLEELSRQVKATYGSVGVHIEDKQSGTVLLQKGRAEGWPVHAIDGALTAAGKDGRAINASGFVFQKLVKISRHAFEKTIVFKGTSRNYFLSQVLGFRLAQKDQGDDLLDTFTYAISLALGNQEGF